MRAYSDRLLGRDGQEIRCRACRRYEEDYNPAMVPWSQPSRLFGSCDRAPGGVRTARGGRGARSVPLGLLAVAGLACLLSACGTSRPKPTAPPAPPIATHPPPSAAPAPPAPPPAAPPPVVAEVLPEAFESAAFIVTFTREGDTAAALAARYLGDPRKAWMVEDYAGAASFPAGRQVAIPRTEWNPPGVYPTGYQMVPVLVYHNIAAQRKGRLTIAASTFEEQMRYLKAEGYHAVGLDAFLAYLLQRRQLPRRSVVISFDDGHRGFLQYARPVLKELDFAAVLFVVADQIGHRANPAFLTWDDLRDLTADGVEVYAHSKTHQDLRRAAGEPEARYARRLQLELGLPLQLLRKQLPDRNVRFEAVAYPFGEWDDRLLESVSQHGYVAGFTVRRQPNPAFTPLLRINRSQVYADWTIEEFKKNLTVFQSQDLTISKVARAPAAPPAPRATADGRGQPSMRGRLAAPHKERAEALAAQGALREALEEWDIALTINADDGSAQARRASIQQQIERDTAALVREGQSLARSSPTEAARYFLAALALDPRSPPAFAGLRSADIVRPSAPPARFLTHTTRAEDTAASLADLYYGDPSQASVIERANGLQPGAPLGAGRVVRIPELPGVPFLRPDR
jgi:peptidoglycan/xylan/chitin deacetylase (PgdA/CDA1 family)/nucleoid-associated protein YgaU